MTHIISLASKRTIVMAAKQGMGYTGPMTSRCILILLDGLGDRAYHSLGDQTPLQDAHTPNLDAIAARGSNGLFHAAIPGLALPSENAHFALFGYRRREFPGRGILEAIGADIQTDPNDVALLAHFAGIDCQDDMLVLSKNRPRSTAENMSLLAEEIKQFNHNGVEVTYHPTSLTDGIVILRGEVSPRITDTDPIDEGMPLIAPEALHPPVPEAEATCDALTAYLLWCREKLTNHAVNKERTQNGETPINGLVTQRAGQRKIVEPFTRRFGLRGASIASGLMYWGLASFLGMKVIKDRDTDNPGKDLERRLDAALNHRDDFPFIHVHTKAPDAAAHTKNPLNKVRVIEELDNGLTAALPSLLDDDTLLIVTSDHSTPSTGPQIHSGEPVPFAMTGPGVRQDMVRCFDEIHAAQGALGSLKAREVMFLVLNGLDRAKLQGLMDGPDDHAYWPGPRTAFRIKK
jgi:2,3-bisphosphoglycerate-independent phosphoglycerate mutase